MKMHFLGQGTSLDGVVLGKWTKTVQPKTFGGKSEYILDKGKKVLKYANGVLYFKTLIGIQLIK